MSLSSRLERAQQRAVAEAEAEAAEDDEYEDEEAEEVVAVAPPAPVPQSADRIAARGELLHEFRLRLQDEVMHSFDQLLDQTDPVKLRAKVAVIVEKTAETQGFAVTEDERSRLIDQLTGEIGGLGPLDPLLSDETDHRDHGQRPEPRVHRARAARSIASTATS